MPPAYDTTRVGKIHKIEANDHLAMLQGPLVDDRSSVAVSHDGNGSDPLAINVAVKRGRLALSSTVTIALVVVLTFVFSGRGVVIDTFDRHAKTIQQQEKLLEKYNSYSGSITAALERPIEVAMALLVQVIVLRVMANDMLQINRHWRVTAAMMSIGAATTYLLANGLSAVNVQVRELPVQSRITNDDLSAPTPDLSASTTFAQSFPEDQAKNPVTNTILRDLVLPRVVGKQICGDSSVLDGDDDVSYCIPQQSWMKDLVPIARDAKSLEIVISETNAAANAKLALDQYPMNASVAADLLIYGIKGSVSAWGLTDGETHNDLTEQLIREHVASGGAPQDVLNVSTSRLMNLLPPTLSSSEQQDREWFLQHAGPTMFNISDPTYKNASLRSWTMTFSHVDIEPDVLWVDAVTVEREVASSRLATTANTTSDSTRYYALDFDLSTSNAKFLPKANDSVTESIVVYNACAPTVGADVLVSQISQDSIVGTSQCDNASSPPALLVVTTGHRLVADALVPNATVNSSKLVPNDGTNVLVNVREVFTMTIARVQWQLQDLAALYNAKCEATGGCMGLDVALPGSKSKQRLVVSANALPLDMAPAFVTLLPKSSFTPLALVTVQRPQKFTFFDSVTTVDRSEVVGDILLAHNIRNGTTRQPLPTKAGQCISKPDNRMATVLNNHYYIEHPLQPTYTAAALFLLQSGVVRDVLNQTWTSHRMLAFSGNTQRVDVYVYIPWLNVTLTFAGCVVLLVAILLVVVWPSVGLRGRADPLTNITAPHTIARVLLNESAFPPLLLTRSIAPATATVNNANEFTIQSLTLERTEDPGKGRHASYASLTNVSTGANI